MKTVKLGVVMDPIANLHYKKDSTLAMLWEATARNWEIFYFEEKDLFIRDGKVYGHSKRLRVFKDPARWFECEAEETIPLSTLNVILMRKDPPFNIDYVFTTQLLEMAERTGVLIINKPQALRDANEKLAATWFSQCCPQTLVSQRLEDFRDFLQQQKEIVCKPLNAMGGQSIFYLKFPDVNASVIFETLTKNGTQFAMAQRYIPEIKKGDKRILLINGVPVPHVLARIPAEGEFRGNLAAGAKGVAQPITERERWICQQVAPLLVEKGLYFVGLDVIGDYLTEVNVTSPTCIRELDAQCDLNISAMLLDFIQNKLL